MIKTLLALVTAMTLAGPSLGQTGAGSYPNKPIRFIVPYAPGGSTSYVARLVGAKLTEAWGQQVLIDNKPGANTAIGSDALAKSAPDGYTISLAASTHVTVPHMVATLPFDVLRDFHPVAGLVTTQLVLVVHPSVPAANLSEFIALAKAKPNELNFAAVGTGSSTHLAGEYFKSVAGVKMQHVPYKGTAPALTDLIGGQIQLNFDTPVTSIPHIKSGRLRPRDHRHQATAHAARCAHLCRGRTACVRLPALVRRPGARRHAAPHRREALDRDRADPGPARREAAARRPRPGDGVPDASRVRFADPIRSRAIRQADQVGGHQDRVERSDTRLGIHLMS